MNQSPDVSSERGPLEPASAKTNFYSSGTWDEFFFNHQRNDIMSSVEPTKTQKVIAKIQQLRAISESTHSINEKETTIALAAKLIAEYQLSEAEVQVKTNLKEEIDFTTQHIIYESGKISLWKNTLAAGLAELNGLFIYKASYRDPVSHKRSIRMRVIGERSGIDIAIYMFEYLSSTISELSHRNIPKGSFRGVNPNKESYCFGCVKGFLAKMKNQRNEVMKAATSSALVLISHKAEQVEEAFKEHSKMEFTKKTQKSKAQIFSNAYQLGVEKGKTLDVSPGLGGNYTSEPKKINE